jgi:6-phosphogluconolactonase (cycloisomerase 2 family)
MAMLYVGFQDNDKIVVFALDGDSGKLTITV